MKRKYLIMNRKTYKRKFISDFDKLLYDHNISKIKIKKDMRISQSTLDKYLCDPTLFKVKHMKYISEKPHININDLIKII